ncbi:RNA pseudouridine synthase 3 mitochondrial [Bienertia sinuspersici]
MGRTKESTYYLQQLFTYMIVAKTSCLVLLDDGKTERVMLAHPLAIEASQEAVTEYRIELRPLTSSKHQLRVHCAEALGTPIVADYKCGWFVHRKWRQTPLFLGSI